MNTINEEIMAVLILETQNGFNKEYKKTKNTPLLILTKQIMTIAQLLNGGTPLLASISFISLPATGIMVSPLIRIVNPHNKPVNITLLKLIVFIFLVFYYFVPVFSWRNTNFTFK